MKESMWAVSFIVAGIIGIGFIFLFINITTNDQNDYYLLKEVTEASMLDAVDVDYYRYHGKFRIVREKFVDSFIRRWSTSSSSGDVQIDIIDVIEMPPKVSLSVTTSSGTYGFTNDSSQNDFAIFNKIDAILETIY